MDSGSFMYDSNKQKLIDLGAESLAQAFPDYF